MNKKDLLDLLQNSTWRYDTEKGDLYKTYYPLLRAKLEFCPEKLDLSPAVSLDENFEDANAFEIFIRSNDRGTVEDKFKCLLSDLSMLASLYLKENFDRFKDEATVLALGNRALVREQKRRHVAFRFFIALFILFSICVLAVSILGEVKEEIEWGGVCAAIIGTLDFLNGIAFFIYEKHDDKKKNALQEEMKVASGYAPAKNKPAKSRNVVKGNVINGNNNFIGNTVTFGGMSKELSDFIIQNGQQDQGKR